MQQAGVSPLLTGYNKFLASRPGYVLLGRALPAILFGLIFGAKLTTSIGLLSQGPGGLVGLDALNYYVIAAYHISVLLFLAMVCLLFITRLPSLTGLSSIRSGIVAIAGSFMSTPLAFAAITIDNVFVFSIAVALMLLGSAVAVVALFHLGRHFGVSPQARGLVTTGPYGWVRHPLYVGEEITALGVLLPALAPATLAVFLLHCLLQLARARYEETVLIRAFPQYIDYQRRIARFFPGIY